jgi:hypothetical protein
MKRKQQSRTPPTAAPITPTDQQIVSGLANAGLSPAEITAHTGLGRPEVARVAAAVRDTRELAKETLQAGAQTLASRVVIKANVAESMGPGVHSRGLSRSHSS